MRSCTSAVRIVTIYEAISGGAVMNSRCIVRFVFIGLLSCHSLTSINAQFEADSRWAPSNSNVIVLVNSSRVFDSAMARKERAAEKARAAFATGTSIVTPDVDRLLIASEVDLEALHTNWTVAVFSREAKQFDFAGLVNHHAGTVDSMAGFKTALLANDVYAAQLGPSTLGFIKPGNRQTAARWLKTSSTTGSSQIADYLKRAVKFADSKADIILAIDLEGLLSPTEVREKLSLVTSVPKDQTSSVAEVLDHIEGATLGVTVRESIFGSLKIDFKQDVSALAKFGKPLIIDVLKYKGVMINDFEQWQLKTTDKSLVLSGPLSLSGMRMINALVSRPLLTEISDESSDASPAPYARTKTYFDSLESYHNDLAQQKPDTKTLMGYAAWFQRYAEKIDELSIVGVDPAAVQLGASMSEKLRLVANGLQNTQSILRAEKGVVRANGGYDYYGYRYSNGTRISQQKAIDQNAQSFAELHAREILLKLSNEFSETRRVLAEKYGVTF